MVTLHWVDQQIGFLTAKLGVYKLEPDDPFFFEPTPGFYGYIAQGKTQVLNEAVQMLASHIGCPTVPVIEEWTDCEAPLVSADFDWAADKKPPGVIRYMGPNASRISLNIVNMHSPLILGAILAHELMHHFLANRDLGYPDEQENETLVDFATAYFGLGKITMNGYEELEWTRPTRNRVITYTYRVGYLSASDMARVVRRICAFRSLPDHVVHPNLTDTALALYETTAAPSADYELRKALVGQRQCPHCTAFASFGFGRDDDGVYCSECGWEWSAILTDAYSRMKRPRRPWWKLWQ